LDQIGLENTLLLEEKQKTESIKYMVKYFSINRKHIDIQFDMIEKTKIRTVEKIDQLPATTETS